MLPSLPPATTGNLKITGPLERKVDEHRGYIHVVQDPSRFSNFPAVSDVFIMALAQCAIVEASSNPSLDCQPWKLSKLGQFHFRLAKSLYFLGASLFDISLTKQLGLKFFQGLVDMFFFHK